MRLRDILITIDRKIRFWYFTTTPAFKDYSKKIRDFGARADNLHTEAESIKMTKPKILTMEDNGAAAITVNEFKPFTVKTTGQTMVTNRREYQGGAENGEYELGDRFDALCNRLEGQLQIGDKTGAMSTFKALEEIGSRLKHKDKSRILSQLNQAVKNNS